MTSYILCVFFAIILAGFVVALIDFASDAHETWQKHVTAEDLQELGKFIKRK